MKRHLVAGLVLGLVGGLAVPVAWRQQEVSGAAEKKEQPAPKWEYKVVRFFGGVETLTDDLNQLAKDGWEYVGPIKVGKSDQGNSAEGYIAFRRPRK